MLWTTGLPWPAIAVMVSRNFYNTRTHRRGNDWHDTRISFYTIVVDSKNINCVKAFNWKSIWLYLNTETLQRRPGKHDYNENEKKTKQHIYIQNVPRNMDETSAKQPWVSVLTWFVPLRIINLISSINEFCSFPFKLRFLNSVTFDTRSQIFGSKLSSEQPHELLSTLCNALYAGYFSFYGMVCFSMINSKQHSSEKPTLRLATHTQRHWSYDVRTTNVASSSRI
jgi:hypothetical protein